jgi:hypothetical protein
MVRNVSDRPTASKVSRQKRVIDDVDFVPPTPTVVSIGINKKMPNAWVAVLSV